jgi:hypothetical protein
MSHAEHAVRDLVTWDDPLSASPHPGCRLPGPLPTRFATIEEYQARLRPLVTEEAREGLRKSFPPPGILPLVVAFRGIEELDSSELLRVSVAWGRREQDEFEGGGGEAEFSSSRGRSSMPNDQTAVLLSLTPSLGPSAPVVLGLATRVQGGGGGSAALDIVVPKARLYEHVRTRRGVKGGRAGGKRPREEEEEGAPPSLDVPLFLWTVENAVTALRECEALDAAGSLHPALRGQLLEPSAAAGAWPKGAGEEEGGPYDRRRYLSPDFVAHALKRALNPSQLEAIDGSLQQDVGFSLIQGPPGTGKTTVILRLLNALHLSAYAHYHEWLMAAPPAPSPPPSLPARQIPVSAPSGAPASASGVSLSALLRAVPAAAFQGQRPGGAPLVMMRGSLRSLLTSSGDLGAGLEAIHRAHALRPRLLVTAPSNTAVDGVLARFLQDGFLGPRLRPDGSGLEVYRPIVRRVGEGAGADVRAAAGMHVESEVERLLGMVTRPGEVEAWMAKLEADRIAILADIASKRAWFQAQSAALPPPAAGAPDPTAPLLANVGSRVIRAVEALEFTRSKLRRADSLSRLASAPPFQAGAARRTALSELRNSLLDEASIVASTTSSAALSSLDAFVASSGRPFAIVVVDEAAQATETSTLIPLRYGARQVVLVGDPQQLPATVMSQAASAAGWDSSLMARLAGGGTPLRMLKVQYRCHPAIMAWPSGYFYGGRVGSSDSVTAGGRAHGMHATLGLGPLLFYDVSEGRQQAGVGKSGRGRGGEAPPPGGGGSLVNTAEVDAVMQLLRALATWRGADGAPFTGSVGVIAFYRAQVFALQAALGEWPAPGPPFAVDVQTVDGFQGQERDVIVLSCVRTVEGAAEAAEVRARRQPADGAASLVTARSPASAIGFLDDPRRINVALTRAKLACWTVGNARALRTSVHWGAFLSHCEREGCAVRVAGGEGLLEAATTQLGRPEL